MRDKLKKIWIPIFLLSLIITFLPVTKGYAANGNIKIDISQGEGNIGDNITVSVVINYDEAITEVSYDLSFSNAIVNGGTTPIHESLTIVDGSMALQKDYQVQLTAVGQAIFQISNYTINQKAESINPLETSISCQVTEVPSNNTRLSGLQLTPGNIVFDPNTTEYHISVGEDVEKVLVKPVLEDPEATYTVVGTDNLQPGENRIVIRVVAADKQTTEEYIIYVNKAGVVETSLEDTTAAETTLEETTQVQTTQEETAVVTEADTEVTTQVIPSTSETSAVDNTDRGILNFMTENKQMVAIICAFALFVLLVIILLIMLMIVRPRRKARYADQYDDIDYEDYSEDDEEDDDDFDIEDLDFDDLDLEIDDQPKEEQKKEIKKDSDEDEFEFIDIDKI